MIYKFGYWWKKKMFQLTKRIFYFWKKVVKQGTSCFSDYWNTIIVTNQNKKEQNTHQIYKKKQKRRIKVMRLKVSVALT